MSEEKPSTMSVDAARAIYQRKDTDHWTELESIVRSGDISFSEMLVNFPAYVRRREMTRLLADYDLFRMILDLPGSIAEACDQLALIPMAGRADSLNLAVATGIMLFEIRRAHLHLAARG